MSENLPLNGIRVLSFAQLGQGPTATQLFGDFGAEVIKIERPGVGAWERSWAGADAFVDGESLFFLSLNRNNKSLTVNLKDPKGLEIIKRLIPTIDVLVENYRPGVMNGLGLGYRDVQALNPRLIYCSASGYGPDGPYVDRPGQDLIIQGLSGLAAMGGRASDDPVPAGTTVVDFHAGAMIVIGTLMALVHRQKTGKGQLVQTNLFQSALHLQLDALFYFMNGFDPTKRSEAGIASPYQQAPYGVYRTADGSIILSNNKLAALAQALDLPELAQIPESEKLPQRDRIKQLIDSVTPTRTTTEWLARFAELDIWSGPVNDYKQLVEDPQFKHMNLVTHLEYPKLGTLNGLRPPINLSSVTVDELPRNAPPELGQHNRAILESLGYDSEEIDELQAQGSI